MKKRFFPALLLGMLAVFICTAAAAEGDFTIKDGVLTKYSGAGGAVVIPDGVTEIAREAFSDPDAAEPNRTITSVTLPAGVLALRGADQRQPAGRASGYRQLRIFPHRAERRFHPRKRHADWKRRLLRLCKP